MGAECNTCGQCCSPVVLGFSQRDIADYLPLDAETRRDLDFIRDHLTELEFEDGRRRAPYLEGEDRQAIPGTHLMRRVHFYRCDFFDEESRLCTAHDSRPPMCRKYPWPDPSEASTSRRLPLDCSYRADLPTETPVALTSKP